MNAPICAASPAAAGAHTQSPAGERSSRGSPTRSPAASLTSPRDAVRPVISRRPPPFRRTTTSAPPGPPHRLGTPVSPDQLWLGGLPAPPAPGSLFVSFGGRRGHIPVSRLATASLVDHDVSPFAFDIETSLRPAPPSLPPQPPSFGSLVLP